MLVGVLQSEGCCMQDEFMVLGGFWGGKFRALGRSPQFQACLAQCTAASRRSWSPDVKTDITTHPPAPACATAAGSTHQKRSTLAGEPVHSQASIWPSARGRRE